MRKPQPRGWAWWDQRRTKRCKSDELIGRWIQRRKIKLNGFPDDHEANMNDGQDHEIEIIREAIVALIRTREFLGYQLSHANGGMDDAQLDEIANEYLVERTYTNDELFVRLKILRQLIGDRLDADTASTMLECSIERVMTAWPTELE